MAPVWKKSTWVYGHDDEAWKKVYQDANWLSRYHMVVRFELSYDNDLGHVLYIPLWDKCNMKLKKHHWQAISMELAGYANHAADIDRVINA